MSSEITEALDLIEEIFDMADEAPERAEEFVSSVQDKAASIQEYIEQKNHVTPMQLDALRNMRSGLSRWLD